MAYKILKYQVKHDLVWSCLSDFQSMLFSAQFHWRKLTDQSISLIQERDPGSTETLYSGHLFAALLWNMI